MSAQGASTAIPQPEIRIRVGRVGWAATSAGSAMTFGAIAFLIPVVSAHDQLKLGLINGPLVVAATIFGQPINRRLFTRRLRTALAWLGEDRAPDEREHRLTLGLAAYAVRLGVVSWLVAGFCSRA